MADPWVRPPSPGPPDSGVSSRPEDEAKSLPGKTPSSDDYLLIDRLREDAAAGRMDLSSILSEATHAARFFTDATGSALALWSQGVVICRARSGDTAPPLGAKVDVDAGVSGECLRSGRSQRCNDTLIDPRVDPEVCQEMGIRSLAAVPLRGGQGVIGILEVFSDRPNAFSDAHITLLKKLAKIAVMGRAKSVTSVPTTPRQELQEPEIEATPRPEVSAWRAAIVRDPLRLLPSRMRGEEGQPYRLVAAALLLLVLGLFGWMFSRSRGGNRGAQAVHAASNEALPSATAAGVSNDREQNISTADAGRNSSTIALARPSKPGADLGARDVVQKASTSIVTQRGAAPRSPQTEPPRTVAPPASSALTTEANLDVPAPDPSEMLSQMQGAAAVPQSVANPQPVFPFVALPVSQGVTGGRLTRKVDPVYPSEARVQRVEGAVVLDALVGEDGNVRDVEVNSGPALLAKAAAQAVKRWRYEPFQLNGKPVAMHNQITIQFKLP